jgi:hypothetical protein
MARELRARRATPSDIRTQFRRSRSASVCAALAVVVVCVIASNLLAS